MTRPRRHATPPSNGHLFRKGESGNPGGKPKWVGDMKALCKEHTEEAVNVLLSVMRAGRTDRDRIAAATYILDRAHGKPVQAISGDPDGAPITITGITVSFVEPKPDSTVSGQA